jgi:hypothetical protein
LIGNAVAFSLFNLLPAVEDEKRGRVVGTYFLIYRASNAFGMFVIGTPADYFGLFYPNVFCDVSLRTESQRSSGLFPSVHSIFKIHYIGTTHLYEFLSPKSQQALEPHLDLGISWNLDASIGV